MTTIEYKRVVISRTLFAGIGIHVEIHCDYGYRHYYPTYSSLKRLQALVDQHRLYADLLTGRLDFTVRQRKGTP